MATATSSYGMFWSGWILSGLVILFLIFDGGTKLLRIPPVMDACARVGLAPHQAAGIGAVLFVCTALYAIPQTSVIGALLLTAFLGGAVAIHVRGGSGWFEIAFAIAFCGLMWLGIILREPQLLWTILFRP